jgi:pyruvate formate lyase activating enzyme
MRIGGIHKVSLIDYPGEICAVVFCQGCNFRCPYCHNPELVNKDLFKECIPEERIISFLSDRIGKLDAVTVTGGEPTIQNDLPNFLKEIKNMGYLVKIDTNGSMPGVLEKIIAEKSVDYIAMDIKGPLGRYGEITNGFFSTNNIEESINLIMDSKLRYEFRTTIVDSLLKEEEIIAIGKLVRKAKRYALQPFVPSKALEESFLNARSLSLEILEKIRTKMEEDIDSVIVRNIM